MPEFMGVKITRAQQSARHAYRRALERAVRTVSKGTRWRSIQGCLFREQSGWFVSIEPTVYIYEPRTVVRVTAKPMSIDSIFWDLVGLPENRDAPLSFRLLGAWTCRPPEFTETDIAEGENVNDVAARILRVADEQLDTVVSYWSVDEFLKLCRERGAADDSYLACIVSTLIAMHREPEALDLCEAAKAEQSSAGFMAPEGTFPEMAARWLRQSMTSSTRH